MIKIRPWYSHEYRFMESARRKHTGPGRGVLRGLSAWDAGH